MNESKKNVLEIIKKNTKKGSKFENLVVNLALQKMRTDHFEFDGKAVFNTDKTKLIYFITDIERIAIPEGVVTVEKMAVTNHSKLARLTLPSTLKVIKKDAFSNCDSLTSVRIPAGVGDIRSYAFAECDQLKRVVFEGVPEHLSRRAFSDCDRFLELEVPEGSSDFFIKQLRIDDHSEIIVTETKKEPAKNNTNDKESKI